jgi:histidinol-phosphate aminotransferase
MLEARKAVRSLPTYHPPLGGREGLRLDFNENTVGCSPAVLAQLRTLSLQDIAVYPERGPVEAVVASHLGIDPAELLLTNGVDEAIHVLCETFLEAGDEAIIVVPTFAMYEISVAATGAQVISVAAGKDFVFPMGDLLARLSPRTRMIAVANPNNPTGAVARPEDLIEIASRAPQAALLVDEAYFEFYGQTLLRESRTLTNLFVARTFSKAYGMAGLRIGVLAGNEQHMAMVRKVSSPYNLNAVALKCVPTALSDRKYVEQYIGQVLAGRQRLQQEYRTLGIPFWPSQANFVLAHYSNAQTAFVQAMGKRGILVRDRSRDPGCDGCVRITLGTAEHTDRLLIALREALEEVGLKEAITR